VTLVSITEYNGPWTQHFFGQSIYRVRWVLFELIDIAREDDLATFGQQSQQ
jgi:hypothetical protein